MCLAASAGVPAFAQAPSPPHDPGPPVVVASGEGVIKRAPDRAWVTIAAESRAKTPQEAQKQNAAAMAAVLSKVKGAGIPADAIQTAGYDLQPEYDFHEGRQTLRGYVARNSIEIRVDTLPRLGEIIELAVSSGATMVRGVRFDLKDRSALERDALKLAVGDARHRAEALAEGAGMKVENVIRIQELGASEPPRPVMMGMARTEALQVTGAPPIEAGEIEIRVGLTITAGIR
jgi:uncharacterized protein YggE